MSKELVISSNRHETRVALIDDDQLVEVYFQRANEYSLAGSIHKGRVTRVLPGMQSAFVDVGLERDTFLYVSDFLEEHEDIDEVGDNITSVRPGPEDRDRGRREGGRDRGRDRDFRRRDQPRVQAPAAEAPTPEAIAESVGLVPSAAPEGAELIVGERVEEQVSGEGHEEQVAGEGAATPAAVSQTASQTAPLAAPQGTPQGDRRGDRGGDQDDRHGRRPRRRRRGGRGFPESKYASGGPLAPAAAPAAETAEVEEESGAEDTLPPLVLPGESLRKYRGAPAGQAAGQAIAESAPEVEVVEVDTDDVEFDEPAHYPPENALPDAPVHRHVEAEVEAENEAVAEVPPSQVSVAEERIVMPPPLPPHPMQTAPDAPEGQAPGMEAPDEEEDDHGDGPAVASGLDEDEDRDIQAMILGEAEGIDVVEDSGEEEAGDEGGEERAAGAESNQSAAEPSSGTAEVRERGGRFPHRVSRRMRGRGRGRGDRGPGDRGPGDRTQGDRGPGDRGPSERGPGERTPDHREPGREQGREQGRDRERTVARPVQDLPSIADLLKEGQEIIVQIAKEPLGQKGARITSHIALPGRYVVYMPTLSHMGVSRKIASDEERQRLKRILIGKRPGPVGGFITRTAAEGRTEDEIAHDMEFLYKLWQDIRTKAEKRPAPMLLHHDLDIVQRILRDQLADSFKAIWIDSEEAYESVLRFVEQFQPALVPKVKLYTREAPIFDAFGVTQELEKALRPKVWLKSGGYIVINQTEALVAIDVNTGKFVGKSNRLEDTIVKTNTEAIKEIVRQIRLRDLGGIIVIDFIDMDERKNRQKVMQVLEETMRVDRAPYKILQFNDFGLVAITRKRVKQSLERTLCSPCPHCDGAGYIKSTQTVVSEILTEARKMSGSVEGKDVMLRVHPDVAKVLKSHQNKYLEELEEVLRRPVLVKSDAMLHHEKFDLA